MRPYLFLGVLLLCIGVTAYGQQMPYPCITDAKNIDHSKLSATCTFNTVGYGNIGDCTAADSTCVVPSTCGKIRIPIAIGIIRQSDGTGGISATDVADNLAETNLHFDGANIEFFEFTSRFIDSDDFYAFSLQAADDDGTEISVNDVANVVNLYFTDEVRSQTGSISCGFAALPGSSSTRSVIANMCAGPGQTTLSHELGHFLGLFHTHEDSRFGADPADNSLACSAGDRIADTGSEPSSLALQNDGAPCGLATPCDCLTFPPFGFGGCGGTDCDYNGVGPNAAYSPDMANFMGSTAWTQCARDHFSVCQEAKMWDVAIDCRSDICIQAGEPIPAFADSTFCSLLDPTPVMSATSRGVRQTSTGCMYWYDQAVGGTLLHQGATYEPIIVGTGAFSFFVEEPSLISPACTSPTRAEIILRSVCSPLDVELAEFDVVMENCAAQVSWQTQSERDNAFFILEHSGDGRFFTQMAKIPGAGTSNQTLDYQFIDELPRWVTNYYRLISVDLSGKRAVSEIITARFDCEGIRVHSLVPNPVINLLTVNVQSQEPAEMSLLLYDLLGRPVLEQSVFVNGDGSMEAQLAHLPGGVYFLHVVEVEGDFKASFRILKN